MSRSALKAIQAAAGGVGEAVYVDDVFSTYLYVGTQAAGNVIDNGMNLDESNDGGGLVWIKPRTVATSNFLFDTKRPEDGVTNSGYLKSDTTDAAPSGIADFSFNTGGNTGFTVGATSIWNDLNEDHCSWTFRKQPGFFDIVTYTGNGTTSHTINHNLGSVPGMIIVKRTDASTNWSVYHRSSPVNASGKRYNLILQATNAAGNSDFWPTTPTSTQFFLGDSDAAINASGGTYVAYLFAHDAQDFGENSDEAIIKCGSYTGNGSANGPEIDLGFEPQWLLVKLTNQTTAEWMIVDNMRGITSQSSNSTAILQPNSSSSELTLDGANLTSTGFKLVTGDNRWNYSGGTFIYVAIRRPHKPASEFAATDLFAIDTRSASDPGFTSGFPVDFQIYKSSSGSDGYLTNRLTGQKALTANSTATETNLTSDGNGDFDYNNGWMDSTATISTLYSWMFRRAPGFFDVVAYTGTNSGTQNVNHNLGVTPELMIGKGRDYATNWYVFVNGVTNSGFLQSDGTFSSSYRIGAPTSTTFEVRGTNSTPSSLNGPHDYIAYLFATVAGISKVGTYSGTGSDVNVDCGFSAGARFVLIKRSDSTGDWYLYDSVRGIVAGNDPYLLLNTTAAQVTNTDYIDPLSSGFTVTSSAPAALNNSGGTYIFLAIA